MNSRELVRIFQYENDQPFRIIDRDGEPWFVLADVCRELDILNPRDSASRLDDDERDAVGITDAIGRSQRQTIINESGLYSLILTSRKAGARRFKKWVTAEVLPSIRRTGSYQVGGTTPAFIRRYNENWDRVSPGHFSILSELAIRLWGRFEKLGHLLADKAANGTENRPDISVGRLFSSWLNANHPSVCDNYSKYPHATKDGDFDARQYPNSMLPLYLDFVDTVWIPEHAERYLKTRDPAAIAYLPLLLPKPQAA